MRRSRATQSRFWRQTALSCLSILALGLGGCGGGESEAPEQGIPGAAPTLPEQYRPPPVAPQPGQAQGEQRRAQPTPVPGASVPGSFPEDLPAPSGAKVIATYDGGAAHSVVVYESSDDPDALVNGLRSSYQGAGWTISVAEVGDEGGMVVAVKDRRSAVSSIKAENGKSQVEVVVVSR